MNITVYLGALEGNDPALGDAVRELGTWIGENGNSLIYGGSKSGLMGQIAESVLNAGGKVTGVEPQFFIDSELQYDEITELIVTKDMAERKAKMIELGDAFIAFPKDAVPLAQALVEGGLPCAEVTFRTAAAEESIRLMTEKFPEILHFREAPVLWRKSQKLCPWFPSNTWMPPVFCII